MEDELQFVADWLNNVVIEGTFQALFQKPNQK